MEQHDVVVVGGGPAGLAAAISAYEAGCTDVVVLERDVQLGGILNQCIHNGFGLHTFKEELTGPEYAARYADRLRELEIECLMDTMVLDVSPERVVTAVNTKRGVFSIQAKSVVLAMGCRERPRGALNIPGFRPAGVFTAGTAQRLVNIEGQKPGSEVVILGSGDIGLIMARRMTLEGAHVACVAELMPYSGGLKRNIVQCLDDYGIPLLLSHTVTRVEGKRRVEAVWIAQVDDKLKPIAGTEKRYPCDTLLLSVGLLPENELSRAAGIELSPITRGPVVDERLQTNIEGVFACGNVLHVHDLVDYVSQEASMAGRMAARHAQGGTGSESGERGIPLVAQGGVRYTVPAYVSPERMDQNTTVRFRVDNVYKDKFVCVYLDDKRVIRRKRPVLAPGEMEEVVLKPEHFDNLAGVERIVVTLEEG